MVTWLGTSGANGRAFSRATRVSSSRTACRERRYATGAHTAATSSLSDKEGGEEFTDDDEEILKLFAAQAATAIANARTHQGEQRARGRPNTHARRPRRSSSPTGLRHPQAYSCPVSIGDLPR